MIRQRMMMFVFAVLVGTASLAVAGAGDGTASDLAGRFQRDLLEVMKTAAKTSVKERYAQLAPSVDRSFHVPLMIQIASGAYWKTATPTERTELVNAFRRMSISTLATLFDSYAGERFEVMSEKPGPQRTQLVMTRLIKVDKSAVDIAYVARRFDSGWRLIDVIVDNGISELKVRRSEYNLVLKNEGIPGLIALLNDKAEELVAEK